jgi:hypothetical protein
VKEHSSLTITLDTEMVEKILGLGENPEANLKIKEWVVSRILQRYAKEVINNEFTSKASEIFRLAISSEITAAIGEVKGNWNSKHVELTPEFKKLLTAKVEAFIRDELTGDLHEVIKKKVTQGYYADEIERAVKKYVDKEVARRVTEGVDQRLAELKNKL